MKSTRLGAVVLCFVASACGARTFLEQGASDGSGGATTNGSGSPQTTASASSGEGAGGFPSHPTCASADGVRLCGGACPALPAPACPGYGCTNADDRATLEPASEGVCWSDLPDQGARPCVACEDGEVCVYRGPDDLICVPESVCDALWDLGATDVCRYADKSAYTHEPLAEPGGDCPIPVPMGDAEHFLCGGGCGECYPGSTSQRCTGRSPSHPFGVCVYRDDYYANGAQPCARAKDGTMTMPCASDTTDYYCGIFDDAPADQEAADDYGVCIAVGLCEPAAGALPGGLRCFDATGKQVAP